jgi:hypothetical protein
MIQVIPTLAGGNSISTTAAKVTLKLIRVFFGPFVMALDPSKFRNQEHGFS